MRSHSVRRCEFIPLQGRSSPASGWVHTSVFLEVVVAYGSRRRRRGRCLAKSGNFGAVGSETGLIKCRPFQVERDDLRSASGQRPPAPPSFTSCRYGIDGLCTWIRYCWLPPLARSSFTPARRHAAVQRTLSQDLRQ